MSYLTEIARKGLRPPKPTLPDPIKDVVLSGGQTTAGTGAAISRSVNQAVAKTPSGGGSIPTSGPLGKMNRVMTDITKSVTGKVSPQNLSAISPAKNLAGQFGQLANGNNYIHDATGVAQSLHDMGDGRFYFIDSNGAKKILNKANLPKSLGGDLLQGGAANFNVGNAFDKVTPDITLDKNTFENLNKNLATSIDPIGGTMLGNLYDRWQKSGKTFGDFIDTLATGGNPIQESIVGQIFGSRSPGERITGNESRVDPWTKPPSGTNPNQAGGSDPFTAQDPNKTPSGSTKVTYYNDAPWQSILGNYTEDPNQSKIGLEGSAGYNNLISANEDPNQISDPINRRYALLQQNLASQNASQSQQEQDALSRRFASMGALNSGAAMRNMSASRDASSRRLGELSNNLAAQQSAEQQAATEAAYGRNMQREAQRLASEESMRGRNLQAQQAQQAAFDTSMNRNMTRDAQRLQSEQDARAFKLEGEKLVEGARQSDLEFDLNKKISEANLRMQEYLLKNPGNLISSIFGDLSMDKLRSMWGMG